MIVDVFLNSVRDLLYGDSVVVPTHVGIGIGTTAPLATDTTLETEVYPYGSHRLPISLKTKIVPKKVVYQLSLLPAQANGNKLTEVGVSNAESIGILTNRIVHDGIEKTSLSELMYQITIEAKDV